MDLTMEGCFMEPKSFDGFYFLPGLDDDSLGFQYFNLKDEFDNGKPINGTSIGDMYHIAFFSRGEDGSPVFDDAFEAILADPSIYIQGLIGANIYGCVLRKTDKSDGWFNNYLMKALGKIGINKLMKAAKSVAEN
jgi:hypothetical protein